MEVLKLAKKDSYQVVLDFKSDSDNGLSQKEAKIRLEKNGSNILSDQSVKWWKILLKKSWKLILMGKF